MQPADEDARNIGKKDVSRELQPRVAHIVTKLYYKPRPRSFSPRYEVTPPEGGSVLVYEDEDVESDVVSTAPTS